MAYRVYSMPGGIGLADHHNPIMREEVMRDVDAMVFVADARGDRNPTNVDALLEPSRSSSSTVRARDVRELPW